MFVQHEDLGLTSNFYLVTRFSNTGQIRFESGWSIVLSVTANPPVLPEENTTSIWNRTLVECFSHKVYSGKGFQEIHLDLPPSALHNLPLHVTVTLVYDIESHRPSKSPMEDTAPTSCSISVPFYKRNVDILYFVQLATTTSVLSVMNPVGHDSHTKDTSLEASILNLALSRPGSSKLKDTLQSGAAEQRSQYSTSVSLTSQAIQQLLGSGLCSLKFPHVVLYLFLEDPREC